MAERTYARWTDHEEHNLVEFLSDKCGSFRNGNKFTIYTAFLNATACGMLLKI